MAQKPLPAGLVAMLRQRLMTASNRNDNDDENDNDDDCGPATAVEAAGHVAFMEAYTKVTDSTGKAPIPVLLQYILPIALRWARYWNTASPKK